MTEHELDDLVASLSPGLFRVGWMLTGSTTDSHELVQESLIALVMAIKRGTIVDNPAAYTRKALFRTHLRLKARRRESRPLAGNIPVNDEVERDQTAAIAVRSAIDTLNATDRAILILRYYCDQDIGEISDQLNLSAGAVRTRISRATSKLRQQLTVERPKREQEPTES